MLTISVYRHKTEKDIYLARNWNYCGGGPNTEFYYATKDVIKAIENANRDKFTSWMGNFDGRLTAKITIRKEMEFDGYKGTMSKELCFLVADFELITLTERAGA